MNDLKRTLTPLRGAALMLNIVVGAGLLALPGLVIDAVGDHALWSWIMCATASFPLLLVFIIMGRRYPHAGGIAHFARMSFGDSGFIIGSLIFLGAVAFGLPAIALTGGFYLAESYGGSPTVYAVGLVVLACVSHLFSSEVAAGISTFVASTIILTLVALFIIGISGVDWDSAREQTVSISQMRLATSLMPFMMIFFAFTGWEVAAGLSEEFRNPSRDFPRAMLLSFAVAIMLYLCMAFVAQNAVGTITPEAVFVHTAERAFGQYGRLGISMLAGVIILANLHGAIWAVSRMVYSLGREGHLPFVLNVNSRGTPVSSVGLTTAVILAVLMGDGMQLFDIQDMLSIAGQNFLILYGIAGISLFRLSPSKIEKTIAVIAILLTAALAIFEGPSLLYPLCLAGAGWLVFRISAR